MSDDDKKPSAVYVSWTTMKSALDQLSQGVHSKIDRSVFAGMAWSIQNQLFAGMRFLGLITGESDPTQLLEDLVTGSEEERKQKLKAILEDRYAAIFALDLMKTTPIQLSLKMGEQYQVSGDTRDRAVRFFLAAVNYVGIPISPLFRSKKNGGPSLPGRKRVLRVRRDPLPVASPPKEEREIPAAGTAKSVKLKSGGVLTISATLDLFALNITDRKFVFDLIDRLEEYEKASA
jgi:hypothetical protein